METHEVSSDKSEVTRILSELLERAQRGELTSLVLMAYAADSEPQVEIAFSEWQDAVRAENDCKAVAERILETRVRLRRFGQLADESTPYSPGEVCFIGEEIYQRDIKHLVEPQHIGEHMVIDVKTGRYVFGEDDIAVSKQGVEEFPDGERYGKRIGYRTYGRI
jgi:hypothetical protein